MNKLKIDKQSQIISALVEGNSIRATCRMTGVAKNTVLKLLRDVGQACEEYQDKSLRNLTCKRIQCDEIWSFCYSKDKNVPKDKRGKFGYGDVWTWTAIDADTKLAVTWLIADRSHEAADVFIADLASRLATRAQITTDGWRPYIEAMEKAFGNGADYAMLTKVYREDIPSPRNRYSGSYVVGSKKVRITGNPDERAVSTSFVERQNLTMRMHMRRFTRLTNAFSKKLENLRYAVALHFMYYNYVRIHQSLRVTPAMESGVSTRLWAIEDILDLV